MQEIIFWVNATIAVIASLFVVTRKNPVYSALWMLVAFLTFAVAFLQLSAPFLAAMHLMVYAGAILVLFLFVIMLLNLREEEFVGKAFPVRFKNGIEILTLLSFLGLAWIILDTSFPAKPSPASDFGSAEMVGQKMFGSFVFPFELLSLLIIIAIIGAVVLAKRKENV
jgi:NADH-quinone oxidoreductase subunit J